MRVVSFMTLCAALLCGAVTGASAQTVSLSADDMQIMPGETKTVYVNMDNGDLHIGAAVIKIIL